jgi:thymidylate synthase
MTKQYKELCKTVLKNGEVREDRTGTGTLSIFSHKSVYDMADGFPNLTTKDMTLGFEHYKGELLWMLEGNTNAKYLAEKYGFKIWQKWQKDETGDLGRVYGGQWREFRSYSERLQGVLLNRNYKAADQISNLVNQIKYDPYSRRMLVSAWNPAELPDMALPPCHWSFECYVSGKEMDTLNLKLHQRSCDVFLGVPYNIGEYSLLLHMLAHVTGLKAGKFEHDMTNVHIYKNHIPQVIKQVRRKELPLPQLWLNPEVTNIFDFTMDDIKLIDYKHHEKLTGSVSV